MNTEASGFKIVAVIKIRGNSQTIEYSYVPHLWEQNGVLYWPQANLRNLRSDPSSRPACDWRTYKCKVKKKNIIGLEEAELWEENFVNHGTDAEDGIIVSVPQPKSSDKTTIQSLSDLDEAFRKANEALYDDGDKTEVQVYTVTAPSLEIYNGPGSFESRSSVPASSSSSSISGTSGINNLNDRNYLKASAAESQGSQQEEHDENKLDIIIKNQCKIIQMIQAESIYNKATAEKLYKMVKEMQISKTASKSKESEKKTEDEYTTKFDLPLKDVADVLNFNKELESNKEYYSYLVNTLSNVGGTSGDEEGRLVAKKMRRILFTDHLLTLFSWTGVSRTPTIKKKEAFQKFEGVLKLFQELVSLADSRWSAAKNEKYFKDGTLKHASQIEKNEQKRKNKDKPEKLEDKNTSLEENPKVSNEMEDPLADATPDFNNYLGEITIHVSDGEST